MEREARETRERRALQAKQEQREQEERQERERQHDEEQQRKSSKSSLGIKTASGLDRVMPMLARCARSPGGWSWERGNPPGFRNSQARKSRILRGFWQSQARKARMLHGVRGTRALTACMLHGFRGFQGEKHIYYEVSGALGSQAEKSKYCAWY